MNPHEKAADLLLKARIESKRMDLLPEDCRPARPEDGYRVQHLLIDRYLEHYGGRTLGYKVACTNKLPQELLGTDEPFYGRLVSPFVRSMPVTIDRNDYLLCILEPEFGFEMAADLPPSGAPLRQRRRLESRRCDHAGGRGRGQPLYGMDESGPAFPDCGQCLQRRMGPGRSRSRLEGHRPGRARGHPVRQRESRQAGNGRRGARAPAQRHDLAGEYPLPSRRRAQGGRPRNDGHGRGTCTRRIRATRSSPISEGSAAWKCPSKVHDRSFGKRLIFFLHNRIRFIEQWISSDIRTR